MTRHWFPITALILCFTLTPCLAFNESNPASGAYRFVADVDAEVDQANLYVADLPMDILRCMKGHYTDIRLFDGSGAEIPYSLEIKSGQRVTQRGIGEILNQVRKTGEYSEVSFRVLNPEIEVNHLSISTDSCNFRYRLSLEGSDDLDSWMLITDSVSIFDYSEDVRLQKTDFAFSNSLFKFYRLRVFDSDDAPLNLKGIEFTYLEDRPAELIPIDVHIEEWMELRDGELTVARIFPHAIGGSIPLGGVVLRTSSERFSRSVSIGLPDSSEGRANKFDSFKIHRISSPKLESEQLSHQFDDVWVPAEFELVVENHNDPPLDDLELEFSIYRHLLYFPGGWQAPLSLYVGNANATRPAYEFGQLFKYEIPAEAQPVLVGEVVENVEYVSPPPPPAPSAWEQVSTNPWLLYGAYILAAMAVLLLIFKAMRRS